MSALAAHKRARCRIRTHTHLHIISFEALSRNHDLCHWNHLKHFFQNVTTLFWALIKAKRCQLWEEPSCSNAWWNCQKVVQNAPLCILESLFGHFWVCWSLYWWFNCLTVMGNTWKLKYPTLLQVMCTFVHGKGEAYRLNWPLKYSPLCFTVYFCFQSLCQIC